MRLSPIGTRMAGMSGLRSIMEDVASTMAGTAEEDWINLGIGNPAAIPEAGAMWRQALSNALAEDFDRVVGRYGPSRGSTVLVDAVVDYFNRVYGWDLTPQHVVIGPGSQMVCFAAAALFVGPGPDGMRRLVMPMVPDYTGYQGLCMHEDGIAGVAPRITLEAEHRFSYSLDLDALARRDDLGMLLISSPGNPTGRAVTRTELDGLITVAEQHDVPLVVDHAYGAPFPRIGEVHVDPVRHRNVINCFSVSKAGLPGERIGFAIGDPDHIGALAAFMSNSVLHAPQLPQAAVAAALRDGGLDRVTREAITPHYRHKRQFMEEVLAEQLPPGLNWRVHSGSGGMFSWIWIDHPWFDDIDMYRRLKEKQVFVVPGRYFFVAAPSTDLPDGHATRCLRLSLSAPEKTIVDGVTRLADTLTDMQTPAMG
ncbi:valine--pyruvate transaminase [Streptomyces sp. SID2888]|uniref:valine--pyruvate transaminase n=1 Tax=Streptomyces sp. SID2888 TaxID=2690256 RepID=UPI0013682738|nr:valine--pyruvate transaminase [Streptomyces sp. SID2888]MYV45643.1 valine--pyruvate transaminase [Streptomyces sp. SID2888]